MTIQTVLSKQDLWSDGLVCCTNSLVKCRKTIIHLDHEVVRNNTTIVKIVIGIVFTCDSQNLHRYGIRTLKIFFDVIQSLGNCLKIIEGINAVFVENNRDMICGIERGGLKNGPETQKAA